MNPKVSIVIPVKEINDYVRESVPKLLELDYDNFEIVIHVDKLAKENWPRTQIIVGEKKNETPPVKRELAVKESNGEIIAFMDDDAYPRRDWLKNAIRHFEHPQVGAVYGPGVTPDSDGLWAKISGEVLSSPLTSWKYIYRYQSAGRFFREPKNINCRKCSGCRKCPVIDEIFTVDDAPTVNFLIRREVFDKAGGFNTKYYPGEDTKLSLNIVKDQKLKIIYDPEVYVWHHRRNSLYKHFQQNGRYAIHRGFFAKRYPETSLRLQYFIPTFFVVFLALSLVALWLLPQGSWLWWGIDALWAIYIVLLFISGAVSAYRQKNPFIGLMVVPIIFLTHVVYGIGLVVGLLMTELKR
ncbi:glycosyltransferase [Patescibacteria group bacterium]